MSALRTAIWDKFVQNDDVGLYVELDGTRFYYEEADQDIEHPYCVFRIFDEVPDFTFDLSFEESFIQFDYYADTAEDCDEGITYIKSLYDYADLDVDGHTSLVMQRVVVMHPEKQQPDNNWLGIVRYTLLIQVD